MNKLAKGAIATGVGVMLLVGGGGTLATWNQAQNASMGSVVAGDLNVVALPKSGVWKNAKNQTIDIAAYKVVPGDILTYTQPMTVTLKGDLMAATLAVTGINADINTNEVTVATVLKDGATALPSTLTQANADGHTITATTTFTFNKALGTLGTPGDTRQAVNKSYDLSGIGYKLEQQAPNNTPIVP